jgi:hypothetical protein
MVQEAFHSVKRMIPQMFFPICLPFAVFVGMMHLFGKALHAMHMEELMTGVHLPCQSLALDFMFVSRCHLSSLPLSQLRTHHKQCV